MGKVTALSSCAGYGYIMYQMRYARTSTIKGGLADKCRVADGRAPTTVGSSNLKRVAEGLLPHQVPAWPDGSKAKMGRKRKAKRPR